MLSKMSITDKNPELWLSDKSISCGAVCPRQQVNVEPIIRTSLLLQQPSQLKQSDMVKVYSSLKNSHCHGACIIANIKQISR